MIKAKLIYIKDKQVFAKENSTLRLIGKPIEIAKKLNKEGFELLHIIDLDAQKGLETNFDVYDKLTYFLHIQVEIGKESALLEKLLKINARVVVNLPTKFDLKKVAKNKSLLVGKIKNDYKGTKDDEDYVQDILIENATLETIKKLSIAGKRILLYKKDFSKDMEKFVFAVIE